jgi:Ca2+-binding EF-hand superfamily protein
MDTDSDGRVSETEFVDARLARANDLFERLDRDDDGLLSDTDRKRVSRFDRRRGLDNTQLQACIAEREAPQGDRLVLQRADTDGDGSVGISEWSAALQAQATQAFALLDANGDGVVDQDEWQEQRNERRAERAEFRDCVRDKRRA